MRSSFLLVFFFFLLLICACKPDDDNSGIPEPTDDGPIELFNTGFELGTSEWWMYEGDYDVDWTDSVSFSGNGSVVITSDVENGNFGYWAQTTTDNIQAGKKLTLKVMVKTENVTGDGAAIVIRGDNTIAPQGSAELFATTEGEQFIGGTHHWKQYEVSLEEPISPSIRSITVYLMLLYNATGTVYYDDVQLIYE